ncbi:MAG: hypothetical protein ACOYJK_11300, partial [Prevotella sp.]
RKANRKMIETNSVSTGVTTPRLSSDMEKGTLYNALGMRIEQPNSGLNILCRGDGSVVKFLGKKI